MSALFSELERSTGLNCPPTYPTASPTSVQSVAAVAVAAAVAGSQLAAVNAQQQQQQQQQNMVPSPSSMATSSQSSQTGSASASPPGTAGLVEDQRALQLAFELSMVGLSDALTNSNQFDLTNGINPNTTTLPPGTTLNTFASMLPGMEDRSKKSQNMTECVPVPSSEHVAEIVGRQGCKIKALRAKTNTYIKTPVRGEEPVFVVTGRKEDVGKAKREILSAAEHFSLIRASRKPALSGLSGKGAPPGPPTNIPGQVTIQVRVPYRVVGLVVGPKGATIKHIQQQTHTYIVTPSRDKEPIFEVTGLPDNVQAARRQIEAHIALRTGNIGISAGNSINNSIGSLLAEEASSEFLASLYKNGFGSLLGYLEPNVTDQYAPVSSSTGSRSCSSSSSSTSSKSATNSRPELINIWKNLGDSIDVDEGLGESPNIWTLPVSSTLGSRCSPSASVSPTDSLLGGSTGSAVSNVNVMAANAMCRRECLVCGDKEVTAALVPCGHNMFCMECANRVCGSGDGICPVCSQTVIQAIRIIP